MKDLDKLYDENNIFAKMLRKEIEPVIVYEDSYNLVIMDIMPQSPGHCLIIPKINARNILDVPAGALQKSIILVQKVAKSCLIAFEAQGISIMQYNEPAGGQTVFHLHFHIVPRYTNKNILAHRKNEQNIDVLIEQAKLLKTAMLKIMS